MDLERAAMLGQKVEKEHDTKSLRLRAAGLRNSMRLLLLPTVPVETIDDEQLSAQALELAQTIIEMRAAEAELAVIRKHLGHCGR